MSNIPDSYLELRLSNFGLLNSIDATSKQIDALTEAKRKGFASQFELRASFIYHEDFLVEKAKILDTLEKKVRSILTPEQYKSLINPGEIYDSTKPSEGMVLPDKNNSISSPFLNEEWDEAEEIAQAAEYYLGEYSFLGITQAQATALTQKQMAIFKEDKLDEYDEYMSKAFQEVFSKEQYEAYQAYVAEQLAVFSIDSLEYSAVEEEAVDARVQEQQETINELPQKEELPHENSISMPVIYNAMLATLKSYFIPERALIRAKLDFIISTDDKKELETLRIKYAKLASVYLDSMHQVYSNLHLEEDALSFVIEISDVLEKEKLIFEEHQPTASVRNLVQLDRITFNKAKELAIRYDSKLDDIAKEIDLLNIGWLTQMASTMPKYEGNEAEIRKRMEDQVLKEFYQTKEIEYWRNISYLLAQPGEYDSTKLQSNRILHQVSVFPVPAKNEQTINFTTINDGTTTVEIISQDGKLLKTVQAGNFQKGAHQLNVDVRDIPATVYFYRITDVEGTSLVKAIKAN